MIEQDMCRLGLKNASSYYVKKDISKAKKTVTTMYVVRLVDMKTVKLDADIQLQKLANVLSKASMNCWYGHLMNLEGGRDWGVHLLNQDG